MCPRRGHEGPATALAWVPRPAAWRGAPRSAPVVPSRARARSCAPGACPEGSRCSRATSRARGDRRQQHEGPRKARRGQRPARSPVAECHRSVPRAAGVTEHQQQPRVPGALSSHPIWSEKAPVSSFPSLPVREARRGSEEGARRGRDPEPPRRKRGSHAAQGLDPPRTGPEPAGKGSERLGMEHEHQTLPKNSPPAPPGPISPGYTRPG